MNLIFSLWTRFLGTSRRWPDLITLGISFGLFIFGCCFIYGIGQKNIYVTEHWQRQVLFGILGVVIYVILSLIDYRVLGKISWLIYSLGMLLLILVLIPGIGKEINNARSWLAIPGFRLQPSEFAKPATLLFVAWVASRKNLKPLVSFCLTGLALLLPFGLIMLQPDDGTAFVFIPLGAIIVFLRGIQWRWIMLALCGILITLPIAYSRLSSYQKERFEVLRDTSGNSPAAYSLRQTKLAIGSGGIKGKGFMNGELHILGHVPRPVAPTDYIFSVISEEGGFLVSAGLLLAYFILISRCFHIAYIADDDLGTFFCAGCGTILFAHIYVNVGMNVGACPAMGIPLPLVSYGGTAVLGFFISLGIVQSIYRFRQVGLEEK